MADIAKKTMMDGDDAPPPRRRVSPLQFLMEVRREMTKVTWPSWKETWLTSVMVLIMVLLTMGFFFFVDLILSRGQMLLIGSWRPFS